MRAYSAMGRPGISGALLLIAAGAAGCSSGEAAAGGGTAGASPTGGSESVLPLGGSPSAPAAGGSPSIASAGVASDPAGSSCSSGSQCQGSCVDLQSDPNHCGACLQACSLPTEQCSGGACVCATGTVDCGAGCVDLASDSGHCGACGAACTSTQVCLLGGCADSCSDGLMACGQSCVDLQSSLAHCGACDHPCESGVCTEGVCEGTAPEEPEPSCDPGLIDCGGRCVDPLTDPDHCGDCYHGCLADSCDAGVCPTVKDCYLPTALASASFTGFEDYEGTSVADGWEFEFNAPSTVYAGAFFFDDGTGTPVHSMVDGAEASAYALSTANAQSSESGGGIGFWLSCIDATAFDGVSLWVRGSTPNETAHISLTMEQTSPPQEDDPAGGGTCEATAEGDCAPAGLDIPVTASWTQLLIPWASFTGGTAASGLGVPVDGSNLTGMTLYVPLHYVPADPEDLEGDWVPEPGAYELQVDGIGFIEPGACSAGEALCDVGCVDHLTDHDHCGSCGNACDEARICDAGACVCPPGQTDCDGACVDLQNDPQNCGACGTPCSGPCSSGACQPSTCSAGMGRVSETCDESDSISVGKYRIINNWWGSEEASGTQCIWDTCSSGNTVGWGTQWQWGGGSPYQVKSFVAIVMGWHWGWDQLNTGLPFQLSESPEVTCGWTYSVNATGTFNVAFDMFTSPDPEGAGDPTEEIMVLLRDVEGSEGGLGSRVADVNVGGANWSIWSGTNNVWNVFQIVRATPSATGATLNMMDFLNEVVDLGLVPSDRYLLSIQAGSEVFDGSGTIDTSSFHCTIQ